MVINQEDNNKRFMTALEVSRYLNIPLSTLYTLTKQGKVQGVKVGRQWRYPIKYVQTTFAAEPSPAAPAPPPQFLSERRAYPRLNSEIPASLCIPLDRKGRPRIQGCLENVSEGGAFFVHDRDGLPIEVNDPVRLTGEFPARSKEFIEIEGEVVYRVRGSKAGIGIRFRALTPEIREVIHSYVG